MPSWLDVINLDSFESTNGRLERIAPLSDQSKSRFTLLDSQSVLCAKGEGAAKFLQGQCTADLEKLKTGESTLGAVCTNKGRVICNFRALKTEDSILLRLSSDLAEPTLEYLKKFAVFFKVEMQNWGAPSVLVALDGDSISQETMPDNIYSTEGEAGSIEFYAEPDSAPALFDFIASQAEPASESDWYSQQIRHGQYSINICTTEKYLPHQLNMDKSGAVSFTKGCYTGQEIVARTEYKGKTKRRVLPVLIEAELTDLHKLELNVDDEKKQQIDLLVAAKEAGDQTITALLLPVEFPQNGELSVNGKNASYDMPRLPYRLAE